MIVKNKQQYLNLYLKNYLKETMASEKGDEGSR